MQWVRKINRIVLAIVIFSAFAVLSNIGSSNMFLGFLGLFLKMAIVPLVVVELYFLLFRNKRLFVIVIFILVIIGYASFFGYVYYGKWETSKENVLVLPEEYDKDYAIVVYGAVSGESIEPSYSLERKRRIEFPENGVYLTKTKLVTTMQSIDSPSPKVFIGDKELEGHYYGSFYVIGGEEKGYNYVYINLYDSNPNVYLGDNFLKNEGLDVSELDNYETDICEAIEVQ